MTRAVKIGIFFVFCTVCVSLYIYKAADLFEGDTATYHAIADNAMGLLRDGDILMSGVVVGKLDKIGLENGKAKLTLKVSKEVPLYENAKVEKVMESMLGTYVLVLNPGDSSAPFLAEGSYIKNVKTDSGLNGAMDKATEVMDTANRLVERMLLQENQDKIAKILDSLVETTADTKQSTENLMKMLTETLKNVTELTAKVNGRSDAEMDKFSKLLENALAVTERLAKMSDGRDEKFNETLAMLEKTLKTINDELAASKGAGESMKNIAENVEAITGKVANGEGSVGKLLTDETLYNDITKVSGKLTDYVDTMLGMQIYVDAHTNYLVRSNSFKTFFDITIQPRPDRFYLLGVVDDPRGRVSESTTTYDMGITGDNPQSFVVTEKKKVVDDKLKFNLQIGRVFGPVALRGGIFQNKAGLGIDYNPWNFLSVTAEVFNFSSSAAPNLRVQALGRPFVWTIEPFSWIYLTVGGEALINSYRDFYVGIGLRFNDNDIKQLVTSVPTP